MKVEELAEFLHQIVAELEKREIKKYHFFIDNHSTHKIKMRYNLALLPKLNIKIQICYLPPYSPKINLVESAIHNVRLKKLHHAPHKSDMMEIKNELTEFLHLKKPFHVQNIVNILQHIKKLCIT